MLTDGFLSFAKEFVTLRSKYVHFNMIKVYILFDILNYAREFIQVFEFYMHL